MLVYSIIYWFICSFILLFIHSFLYLFIYSFILIFIHSFDSSIHGCLCEKAISIDNQYYNDYTPYLSLTFEDTIVNTTSTFANFSVGSFDVGSKFYRGPYAFAVSDYTGYDCSYMGCPRGDNPLTLPGTSFIKPSIYNRILSY